MQTKEHYLKTINIGKEVRQWLYRSLLILSLFVVLGVFWQLKLTGITMAGEAFCGRNEHAHSEACIPRELTCPLEEVKAHRHSPECCGKILQCELPEQEGHTHSEECRMEEMSCLCGLEETQGHAHSEECGSDETGYLCGLEEMEPHFHGESCYGLSEESVVCGLAETEGHTHGDDCYEVNGECPLEEHIHIASCYSDLTADLETSTDWTATLADLEENPDKAAYLVQVASSQLGYQESVRNFMVDEHDHRRGITRYGQWYGNPYGDWSGMFVAFCLHYSGLEDLPVNAGPEAMRAEWDAEKLFGVAAYFVPEAGNLLFLDKDGNGLADAVAIVTAVSEGQIRAIEGDVNDTVTETDYATEDPAIMGYGRIPEEQPLQPGEGTKLIAQTENDSQSLFTNGSCLVVYFADGSEYYAIDGYGEIAQVMIDEEGWVYTDLELPELLLWNVMTTEDGGYVIENVITQMYLPEGNMAVSVYALADAEAETEPAPNYQYARAVNYKVWLDGTNGGLMSYGNAANTGYDVTGGSEFVLPETWQSTEEYAYTLRGWYDVVNNKYYQPGDKIVVNSNLVFYADWAAATYDIGRFNSLVANTVSTNEFVTVRMFDYGVLFNVLSSSASVQFNNGHTETWNLITKGKSPYSGEETLNYIFRDWDQGSQDITYPNGVNNPGPQYPTEAGSVYAGLYTSRIGSLLFDPGVSVIGKAYLGTADHLFQLCTDPTDSNYGYYYYDSERNAASYNQSDRRFYVYDYLEQTTVSSTTEGTGKYSDFLPLNSPYANNNGRAPATYSYSGKKGEYAGVTHYMYDGTNSNTSNVATNFFFGMSVEIDFYLPNAPGQGGNKDVYGRDMHFKFTGDDDVWVFVDGKMVLDLGGIHGMESGDVNFTSGEVTVNGKINDALTRTLKEIGAGEHTLTLYYLERGSSMSNCAIYFNLAPRFSFSIQKEDVLTKDVLNGAQFSVFTDKACTQKAELWVSKESHDRGDPATNVFTVTDGEANMWGMGSGNTYYIKETKPPDNTDYTYANGIIAVTIDKQGIASYNVELMNEANSGISAGFTVHGFRIDEQTQKAYIVATNAPKWVTETTGVWAFKKWADNKTHSGETVTVYLTVTDPDGTVRRLQEAQLSNENDWKHRWENLPKYAEDGVTEIQYGVEEAYVSGYFSKVNATDTFTVITNAWESTTKLENGKTYLLSNGTGYLSTIQEADDTGFKWVSKEVAESSKLALWTVKTSGQKVMLTNGANQTLSFYYGNGNYITDFFAATSQTENNDVKRNFNYSVSGNGIRLYFDSNTDYYLSGSLNDSSKFAYTTNANNAMVLTPWIYVQTTTTQQVEGWGFEIVNTPLEEETSLTVKKYWDYGNAPAGNVHEQAQVTIALLANGKGTGRTVTLSLRNNWEATFRGLPYRDDEGNIISYTVEETWDNTDWVPSYGAVMRIDGSKPTYSTHVTNRYRLGMGGPELPSTGSRGRLNYILCGSGMMLFSLVYGIGTRRKRERRME